MDLTILLILVIVVVIIFKDTKSLVYALGIADVFMKWIHCVKAALNVPEFTALIDHHIPNGLLGIIDKYTTGIVNTLLLWLYIIAIAMFLFYLVRYLIRRK